MTGRQELSAHLIKTGVTGDDEADAVLVVVLGDGITMDTFQERQEEPLSLHKYVYCQDDPVNGTDPSGNAAYFVERGFEDQTKANAWSSGYGPGYLLFTSPTATGLGDPFDTQQPIVSTFSFHPNTLDFQGQNTPGRVTPQNEAEHLWRILMEDYVENLISFWQVLTDLRRASVLR